MKHALEQVRRDGPEVISASSPVDDCIFGLERSGCYDLPLAEQERLRKAFVRSSFERHRDSCPDYGRFCARAAPDGVSGLDDIPILPASAFKRTPPISVAERDVAKWCLSSGTQGRVSSVPRDRLSIERLLGSVKAGLELIEDWSEEDIHIINLGPDQENAGEIWFSYVMSLVELMFPTSHMQVEGVVKYDDCLDRLTSSLDLFSHVGIVGPPFRILDFARRVEAAGGLGGSAGRVSVLTAGGWKRLAGSAIPRRELEELLGDVFGMTSGAQYRDAFNQVELNTVVFECRSHRKHVPPWVHVAARDPATLGVLEDGAIGLLSFMDASALGYPAFFVGDDVGRVTRGRCGCGREGVFLEVLRRVEGRAAQGCALALEASGG